MDILSNKDKILEDHARHVARIEGREFHEVKTTQGDLDEMQAIKTLLMAILGRIRSIDAYIGNPYGRRRTGKTVDGKTEDLMSIKELNRMVKSIIDND